MVQGSFDPVRSRLRLFFFLLQPALRIRVLQAIYICLCNTIYVGSKYHDTTDGSKPRKRLKTFVVVYVQTQLVGGGYLVEIEAEAVVR